MLAYAGWMSGDNALAVGGIAAGAIIGWPFGAALGLGKGRGGKRREGKGREGKGREGKGREGKGRERKGREGK